MGDQALVPLTGQHRDAIHPRVVPKPVSGHADHAAAGPEQHVAGEARPVLVGNSEIGDEGS